MPRFEAAACPFDIPAGELIRCGHLVVPENRDLPAGPTIRLGVAIIKSRVPRPAPDPLIFLNGGPGSWTVEDLPRYRQLFPFLLTNSPRDVILLDQRGVGWSQPVLDCPELKPVLLKQAQGQVVTPAEEQAAYLACRDQWLGQGVDLAAYTVAASAADVDDLWRTLGYTRVNLYGISYGTLLAQTVMRDFPAGLRTVVLDSAYPLQISLSADAAPNLARSLKHIFATCAADLLCRTIYPDLEMIFYDLLDQLNRTPARLTTTSPTTGAPFTFSFTGADLLDAIRLLPPRQLPGLIYDLHDGNYTAIVEERQTALKRAAQYGPPPSRAMAYSIFCSHSLYFATPEQVALTAAYPEAVWANRFFNRDLMPLPCETWLAHPYHPAREQPVRSDIPTLILWGEYDSTLAPSYAGLFATNLSQSFVITVPNTGHGVLLAGGPCINTMTLAFLNDPTHPPDDACLAATGSPIFDTRFVIRATAARLPVQLGLGLMSLLILGLAISAGQPLTQAYAAKQVVSFTWQNSLRLIGWWPLAASTLLLFFVLSAAHLGWLDLQPAGVIALLLPFIAALQAAFLFSPEDEPALEILLAAPRPLAWTLLERLATLFLLQGAIALSASLYLAGLTGEPAALSLMRWGPLLICLSGVAVAITLITRRAIFGILVVSLVWVISAVFGDLMVDRWPFTWPLHLYLSPGQPDYGLNRLFITLLGLSLIGLAAARLLNDEERLLLGHRHSKWIKPTADRPANRGLELTPAESYSLTLAPGWSMFIHQLGAMLRYEFLLHWRRAALPALVIGLLVTPVLGAFMAQAKFSGYDTALAAGALSPEMASANITAEMMLITWLGAVLMLMLFLPLVTADTIPKDQHLGIRELLDSLPLGPGVYLAGKLFSLWASLFAGLALAGGISSLVWRWLIGPFNLGLYLELWLVGVTALALINAGLTMFLAAGQPTNRRATFVGIAFSLLCLLGLGFTLVSQGAFWDFLNPARPILLLYYFLGWPGAIQGLALPIPPGEGRDLTKIVLEFVQRVASRERMFLSLGLGLAQVGLVGWLVWCWLRRDRP